MHARASMLEHVHPLRAQLGEEALRIADAGDAVHARTAKSRERPPHPLAYTHRLAAFKLHREYRRRQQRCQRVPGYAAVHHHGIHLP